MYQLDRYIARSVASAIFLVLLVLVSLFLFFTFIEEARDIGEGNYHTWDAIQFVFLLSPKRIYELFPMAVLLGSLIGLGALANNSELTVMRAAGVSIQQIIWSVLKLGLILIIPLIILGETLAPYSEQYAHHMRSAAKSDQISARTKHGFWAREGDSFIHIKTVAPGGELEDISVYGFDDHKHLTHLGHAEQLTYRQDHWLVSNYAQTRFSDSLIAPKLSRYHSNHTVWRSLLNPQLLSILTLKSERLSGIELFQYVRYLKTNELESTTYELALWQKIFYPLVTAIMIFLAVPFVFGSMRTVSVGQRVLIGAFLGILFHIINQASGHTALVYGVSPFISALLPIICFFILGLFLMRRVT